MIKRFFVMCFFFIGIADIVVCKTYEGQLEKQYLKECKKQAKKLSKEGWTVWATSQTIEKAMESHYAALQNCSQKGVEIKGHGNAKTENLAIRKAENDASVQLAQMKGVQVESNGKLVMDSEAEGYVGVNNVTSKHRIGKMVPTLRLMRTLPDGSYEALLYYIMEEE